MTHVGIISVGSYLPSKVLSNFDLEKMVDTTDEWITSRTGIKERRVAAKDEKTSDLATKAALNALKHGKLEASKIDLIIVATISPDSNFPSVACIVQKNIGATKAAAFDISAACSGFLYAMTTAKQFIQTGLYKNALIIAAEKITSLVDWNDRSTCVLFGDGAGACVLAPTKSDGIISEYMHAEGEFGHLMAVYVDYPDTFDPDNKSMGIPRIAMQGKELFKVAVNSMAAAVEHALKKAKLDLEEVDCVVPHQANDRIISAVAKKLGIPKDKFYINIDRYGNMSAASLAVALCEAVEAKKIKKGSNVVLVAFGAGLVSAANVVKW